MPKINPSDPEHPPPAQTADLADRFIDHVEAWLTGNDQSIPMVSLDWPDDHPQNVLRRQDERRREQAQADLIRDGRLLAAALVAYGLDSAPLLTLLNHTKPGECIGGANTAEAVWAQAQVALQVASIQLRQLNTNAGSSTLPTEDSAVAATGTEAAMPAVGVHSGHMEPAIAVVKRGAWNALTDRQRNSLRALLELRAFDADSRRDAKAIAAKAEGPQANVNGFKGPLADLARRGLAEGKTGRKGGYWLADRGRDLLAACDDAAPTDTHSS